MNKAALLLTIALSPLPLAAEPLQFNWQQTRATVTETVKEDNSIVKKMRYDIELQAQQDGTFLLKHNNHSLLSQKTEKSNQPNELNYKTTTLTTTFPDLLIGSSGEFLDAPGWDEHYAKMLNIVEQMPEGKGANTVMLNPELSAALKVKFMLEPWCAWVCLWAGLDPKNPPPSSVSETQLFGFPFDLKDNYQVLNSSKNSVTLRYSSIAIIRKDKPIDDSFFGYRRNTENRKIWTKKQMKLGNQVVKSTQITATLDRHTLQPQKVELFIKQPQSQDLIGAAETTNIYEFKWH